MKSSSLDKYVQIWIIQNFVTPTMVTNAPLLKKIKKNLCMK